MTKAQLESLYGDYLKKKKFGGVEGSFFQATNVPFENYPDYARTVQAFGFDPHSGVPFTGSFGNYTSQDVDVLFNSSSTTYNLQGLVQATEAYWRSQKQVGFLIRQDPKTGEIIEELVDETYIVPEDVTEVEDDVTYEDLVYYPQKKMNTIRWTWVNEVWGGTKVNIQPSDDKATRTGNTASPAGLYIDVKPIPFQFKGNTNPYEVKLPVCGAIFNNRNAKSMSIVDMMKPYQIIYNVFMNKIFQLASTDMGKILLLDPRLLPNDKDWGGEKNLEKWITATKHSKVGQLDTSPGALAGSANGQQHFSVQDLTTFAEIKATVEIARLIEEQAMFQVGITMQRLGIVQASETATGVQQSVTNSYAQTESYFTKFSNYKKRVLQMNLDIAQFCAATDRDMTLSLIQDDMSRQFIKMNGVDLLNSQLGVLIFNSQELLRQNELVKQLILKNNTANASMSALAGAIYTESPSKLIGMLKKMEDEIKKEQQAERQHEQEMQDKQIQAEQQKIDSEHAWKSQEAQLDREASLQEKVISVMNFDQDVQNNGVIDAVGQAKVGLEQEKLAHDKVVAARDDSSRTIEGIRKDQLEKAKMATDKEVKQQEAKIKRDEMANRLAIERKKQIQIETQNKSQEKIATDKHKSDMELADKQIELKKLELQKNTTTAGHEVASSKDDSATNKALNRIKVATARKLAAEKIKKAKNPPKQ